MEVLLKRWVMRDGERMLVTECDARGVPGASAATCLICETDSAMRRIWNFPVDWHRLEDAQVLALFELPFAANSPAQPAAPSRPAWPRRADASPSGGTVEAAAWH